MASLTSRQWKIFEKYLDKIEQMKPSKPHIQKTLPVQIVVRPNVKNRSCLQGSLCDPGSLFALSGEWSKENESFSPSLPTPLTSTTTTSTTTASTTTSSTPSVDDPSPFVEESGLDLPGSSSPPRPEELFSINFLPWPEENTGTASVEVLSFSLTCEQAQTDDERKEREKGERKEREERERERRERERERVRMKDNKWFF